MAVMCKTPEGTMIAQRYEENEDIKGIDMGILLGDGNGTFDILFSLEYDEKTKKIKLIKKTENLTKYDIEIV